ncbi:YheT family hydrolase [Hahella ganghwensis]|uniref:YheT family hydrolase n=1 Tax=Hahella ganghwensis TaxID=286420 RepID=UPI0003999532|nr:alpha/beta fold hydrolase [Hahella ganghwensis]
MTEHQDSTRHRNKRVEWSPKWGLRNPHTQSMLASIKLRAPVVRRRAREVIETAEEVILDCKDGVRIHGLLSRHDHQPRETVVLIHGWEGCADSLYLLSIAGVLYKQGYDIFRLHLRDHGPTHHLNQEMFHACLLDEICEALHLLQCRITPPQWYLLGFSLGGNFALRVGTQAQAFSLNMQRVIGISPLLHAKNTLWALENGLPIYRGYFRKKWRKSINRKAEAFPELVNAESFTGKTSLTDMSHYFVTHHTPFDRLQDYFDSYALTGETLTHLQVPSTLIMSEDDPVIPLQDLAEVRGNHFLDIVRSPFGGHCGFIENYRLDAWIDQYVCQLLQSERAIS